MRPEQSFLLQTLNLDPDSQVLPTWPSFKGSPLNGMNHSRQEKLSVISSPFEQTKQKAEKKTKESVEKARLTNPCSPPASWPPPPSCGCDDAIKCSAVSRWTQLNVAVVMMSFRLFPFTRFRKGVRRFSCSVVCMWQRFHCKY